MKKKKHIMLISILSLVLALMIGGCAGCKKTPVLLNILPNSGPETGGTTITLTGENFKEGATVTVGGNAATNVTVQSKTEITAVTPPGSVGTVNVVVKNPDVEQLSEPQKFTYTDATPPTVISTTPANGESPDYTDPVDTGIDINATFSEPIRQGFVTMTVEMETLPDALTTASGDIPGIVNYDSDTTIRFTPTVPLKAARRYTVSISGAKDIAGNEMSDTQVFSFELKTPKRVRWYIVKEEDIAKEGNVWENIADRPDTYDDENQAKRMIEVNQNLEDYIFYRDLKPGQRLLIK
jgi:hypothetical protein